MAEDTKSIEIVRIFPAPRELVFKAWSSAEHLKRWFSPECFTTPEAEIDFRPGGVSNICMRAPDGQDFWSRGRYLEIVPPEKIVTVSSVGDPEKPAFRAHATVTFEEVPEGTRLTIRQTYEIFDPAMLAAVEGAPEGWRTTLDKLEKEVARIKAEA